MIALYLWDPAGGVPDFVKTLYQNILDREPESGTVDGWTNHTIANGLGSTIKGFFNSPEFARKNLFLEATIEKMYRSILGRHSDVEGKAHWVGQLRSGTMNIDQVIDGFVNSAEYQRNVQRGTAPSASITSMIQLWDPASGIQYFVKTLYQNTLDREPESGAVDGWTHHTKNNGLASTIKGFFNSPEFARKNLSLEATVEKLYRSILGRHSDADGKIHWVGQLRSGAMNIDQVIDGFLNSAEYQRNVQRGTAISAFVTSMIQLWDPVSGIPYFVKMLYQNILDREPESGAVDGWAHHTSNNGLASTIKGFFSSPEFARKNLSLEATVEKMYRSILGRHSDVEGKAHWVGQLRSGAMNIDQVVDGFVNSAEYQHNVQYGTAPSPSMTA